MQTQNRDVVVIGGSAGSLEVFIELLGGLPADLPASVFIVQHVGSRSPGMLAEILNRAGPLPVHTATHGTTPQQGHVYVAPPDRHLLVSPGRMSLSAGPRENHSRPAIDPLFRSAAVGFGSRVIGAVCSGMLDDGTAGLQAIKRCGGLALVQDPEDASYPDMPQSALEDVDVDITAPAAGLAEAIDRLSREPVLESPPVPQDLAAEVAFAENLSYGDGSEGAATPFICPDCGGPLYERHDGRLRRYRCLTGHTFSARALLDGQDHAVEQALWSAVRILEERAKLTAKLIADMDRVGRDAMARTYRERLQEFSQQAAVLREFLVRGMTPTTGSACEAHE